MQGTANKEKLVKKNRPRTDADRARLERDKAQCDRMLARRKARQAYKIWSMASHDEAGRDV